MKYGKKASPLRIAVITVSVLLAVSLLTGGILFAVHRNKVANQIVDVEQVYNWSTSYWGDQATTSGRIISDYVQELYPNAETSISEIFVQEGDEVKIGDMLLQYDTTKLDINVESKKLDVEKQEYELDEKRKELVKLQNTTPIEDPGDSGDPGDPDTPADPDDPSTGDPEDPDGEWLPFRPLEPLGPLPSDTEPTPEPLPAELQSELTEHSRPFAGTGTSEDPFVFLCTKDCTISWTFLSRVLGFQSSWEEPTPTPSPTPTPTPSPTPFPAEGWNIPFFPSSPSPSPTPGPYTLPEGPFAVRLEVHKNNSEAYPLTRGFAMDGNLLTGGLLTSIYGDLEDLVDDLKNGGGSVSGGEEGELPPGMVEVGGGGEQEPQYTEEQLTEMINSTKQAIRDLEVSVKQAQLELRRAELELSNASVKATVSGTVRSLTDLDSALFSGSPFLVVSGGSGFYLEGSLPETLLGQIHVGDVISANSWETGASYSAQIVSISEYPTGETGYSYSYNPNSSTYQFRAYIPESDGLRNNLWVDVSLSAGSSTEGQSDRLYLHKAYVRSDADGKYVLKAGPDMCVHKEYVTTGKTIYDQYVEITGGDLSRDDYIAFPYGTNAVDGARINPEQEINLGETEVTE